MADVVVELADGSSVVLAGASASPRELEELEVWALVPADAGSGADVGRGDVASWHQALEAGPLLVAVLQGVLVNAAWAAFPAATRYLQALWSGRQHAVGDAVDASTIARRAVSAVDPQASVGSVTSSSRDGEGVWRVRLELSGGRRASVRIAGGGTVTHVQIHA